MQKHIVLSNGATDDIKFILRELQTLQQVDIGVAKGRHFTRIDLEFEPERLDTVKNTVVDTLAINRKKRYIISETNIDTEHYPMVALISALIYFDHDDERMAIANSLNNTRTYSIEGVYSFRMKSIIENWAEIVSLTKSLLDTDYSESDIYNVVSFMMSPRLKPDKSIFIADIDNMIVTNVSEGGVIRIKRIFDEPLNNLIAVIAEECPSEVLINSEDAENPMVRCLKNFVKIKVL